MEQGLGIVHGRSGPLSLSAVFSSLVSSMGTTGVACRDDKEMRSDGVHGRLKTTSMTTAPQFQLQRTSRGWVRRKKEIPSDTNRGAFRILLVGLCSLLPSAFGGYPSHQANHLGGSQEGRSVLWTGSGICWERNSSFTSADGSDHVAWEQAAVPFLLT